MKKTFTTLLFAALGSFGFAQENTEVLTPQGIIVTPAEGVKTTYLRSGGTYELSGASVAMGRQSGTIDIVECEDHTVYLQNPISCYLTGAWVKGTRSGNTITVPANQPLTYSEEYNITLNMNWGTVSPDGVMAYDASHAPEFVYTIDGNTMSLAGTSPFDGVTNAPFVGLFWDDEAHTSTYYGDYSTVYTYDPTYVPASTEPIALPDDLYAEPWTLKALTLTSATPEGEEYDTKVLVGFVDNDVYMCGLFTSFPDAWIKGTIEGTKVTFPKLQFIGKRGAYNVWMTGRDEQGICDAEMEYDAAAKTFTSTTPFLANAAEDHVYYITWLDQITISATSDPGDNAIPTGDPVEELPYVLDFDTPAQQATLGILNANGDNFTWHFFTDETSGNVWARYFSSYTNAADDYLITPAVRLEAGRTYKVAMDVFVNTFYGFCFERFEVLAGLEARRSALTLPVIGSTDLYNEEVENYANDSFSVPATGFYHFAIHAISDIDQNLLFLDNFTVSESNVVGVGAVLAPAEAAPCYNLQGQRLPAQPSAGVYVKDGLKCLGR